MTWLALRALPWKLIGFAALGLALAGLVVALKLERAKSADLAYRLTVCQNLREADHAAYKTAQEDAARLNREQVGKIEQEQRTKTDAIQSRWNADRVRLAELMRHKGTAAPQGSAGGTQAIPVPGAAEGSDGTGQVCIPEGDALSAAENELKLHWLQEWIRGQLRVAR